MQLRLPFNFGNLSIELFYPDIIQYFLSDSTNVDIFFFKKLNF
jgi:hypothetical protein